MIWHGQAYQSIRDAATLLFPSRVTRQGPRCLRSSIAPKNTANDSSIAAVNAVFRDFHEYTPHSHRDGHESHSVPGLLDITVMAWRLETARNDRTLCEGLKRPHEYSASSPIFNGAHHGVGTRYPGLWASPSTSSILMAGCSITGMRVTRVLL